MTAAATAGPDVGIGENGKYLLRPRPAFNVNFLICNPACRLHHAVVLTATRAELTLSVRWNLNSHDCRPQVCDLTEKFHGTLAVPVFHLAIGRTHPAQRLDPALDALGYLRALARARARKRTFPDLTHPNIPNAESLLLRNHTNTHLSVSIDGKPGHPSATVIHGIDLCEIRRLPQIMLRQPAILARALRSTHIERHHFLRRKPNCQRTLRTVNPRIDLPIHLEFHAQFFLGEPPHRGHFMLVDAGGYRLQLERQSSFFQQLDPVQAAVIRSRNRSQRLIRFPRAPI